MELYSIILIFIIINIFICLINIYKENFKLWFIYFINSIISLIHNVEFAFHNNWVDGKETSTEWLFRAIKEYNIRGYLVILSVMLMFFFIFKKFRRSRIEEKM